MDKLRRIQLRSYLFLIEKKVRSNEIKKELYTALCEFDNDAKLNIGLGTLELISDNKILSLTLKRNQLTYECTNKRNSVFGRYTILEDGYTTLLSKKSIEINHENIKTIKKESEIRVFSNEDLEVDNKKTTSTIVKKPDHTFLCVKNIKYSSRANDGALLETEKTIINNNGKIQKSSSASAGYINDNIKTL